jgi:hypothetical protein
MTPADEDAVVGTPRLDQSAENSLGGIAQAPQEVADTPESAKTGQWEKFRNVIHQLYIVENYTLDSVMKIMADRYAFTCG